MEPTTKHTWRHKFRTPRKVRRQQKRQEEQEQKEQQTQKVRSFLFSSNDKNKKNKENPSPITSNVNINGNEQQQSKLFRMKKLQKDEIVDEPTGGTTNIDFTLLKNKRRSTTNNNKKNASTSTKNDEKSTGDDMKYKEGGHRGKDQNDDINDPNSSQNSKSVRTLKHNDEHENNIPITYEIMRSIVTLITYIEHKGGLDLVDGIYTMPEIIKMNGTKFINRKYQQLQPFVNQCIDQIVVHGESSSTPRGIKRLEDLDLLFHSLSSKFDFDCQNRNDSCHVVGMALLGLLNRCDSLIPEEILVKIMSLKKQEEENTAGDEIEELLSNPNWPQFKSMTFITILHHLVKLWKSRLYSMRTPSGRADAEEDNKVDKKKNDYIQNIAKQFAKVLLVNKKQQNNQSSLMRKTRSNTSNLFFVPRKKKKNQYESETKVLILILSLMMEKDPISINITTAAASGAVPTTTRSEWNKEKFSSPASNTSAMKENMKQTITDEKEKEIRDKLQFEHYDHSKYSFPPQDEEKVVVQGSTASMFRQEEYNEITIDENSKNVDIIIKAKNRIKFAEQILERINEIVPLS